MLGLPRQLSLLAGVLMMVASELRFVSLLHLIETLKFRFIYKLELNSVLELILIK